MYEILLYLSEFHGNFRKVSKIHVETFDLPYDFDSLMHYPTNAFAKPGANATMYATVRTMIYRSHELWYRRNSNPLHKAQ